MQQLAALLDELLRGGGKKDRKAASIRKPKPPRGQSTSAKKSPATAGAASRQRSGRGNAPRHPPYNPLLDVPYASPLQGAVLSLLPRPCGLRPRPPPTPEPPGPDPR